MTRTAFVLFSSLELWGKGNRVPKLERVVEPGRVAPVSGRLFVQFKCGVEPGELPRRFTRRGIGEGDFEETGFTDLDRLWIWKGIKEGNAFMKRGEGRELEESE